jgi:hypothetical protein
MNQKKLVPGCVVYAFVHYGSQTKVRPAIVIEVQDDRVYLLLGSTKGLVNDPTTVIVSEEVALKSMGLRFHTQFHWGGGGNQWVSVRNVERIIGNTPSDVLQGVGVAWANAKFNRVV